MEALGRVHDLSITLQTQKRIYVGDVAGFSLVAVDAPANLVTVQQHTLFAAGSTSALNFVKRYKQTAGVWSEVVAASGNTFTPDAAADLEVIEFDTDALADGFKYVSAAIATAGTLLWVLHDLQVQRKPVNMRRLDS